jgi:alpha-amylase/alpha-mannosidase (GH57 family)
MVRKNIDLVYFERYPKLHQTVNLVPSLILQLEDHCCKPSTLSEVALTPNRTAQHEQKQFIIEHFLMAITTPD